jgi:hypothetical protein
MERLWPDRGRRIQSGCKRSRARLSLLSNKPVEKGDKTLKRSGDGIAFRCVYCRGDRLRWRNNLDAHPSFADRIASARRENAPGIFHLDWPATALFSNLYELTRPTSLDSIAASSAGKSARIIWWVQRRKSSKPAKNRRLCGGTKECLELGLFRQLHSNDRFAGTCLRGDPNRALVEYALAALLEWG